MRVKGKWARGISIIGAGMSRMGTFLDSPWLRGMTEREVLSWAVLEACQDAEVMLKDIDCTVVGMFMGDQFKTKCVHAIANSWLGLDEKPGYSLSHACGMATAGIMAGGSLIASGLHDVVVVCATSTTTSLVDEDLPKYRKHPGVRVPCPRDVHNDYLNAGFDQAYFNPIAGIGGIAAEGFTALHYAKKYGLTWDDLDEALLGAAISLRRGSVLHPKSLYCGEDDYAGLAKKTGFKDEWEYARSLKNNPMVAWPFRASSLQKLCDGAAALVLCATEDAKKYTTKPPIEVSGIGQSAGDPYPPTLDLDHHPCDEGALNQAYAMADLNPEEIDYFGLHDFKLDFHLTDPEKAGYLGPGKAWKALIDGETAFDGKKPIQTHGGESHFGNPYDPASIIDFIEPVQQMRGECGERQIQPAPKCAVVFGRGTGPVFGVGVLRRREGL